MPDYSLGEQLGPLEGIIAIVIGTLLAFWHCAWDLKSAHGKKEGKRDEDKPIEL